MADDLRDQIADAITYHPGNRTGTPEQRHPVSLTLADAVMRDVVGPELERLRTELADMKQGATVNGGFFLSAEAEVERLGTELKNMTLAYNGANAMKGVHKRRADLLLAELLNAKAALTGDIGRFAADCDERAKRARERMAVWQRAAEQAEDAIERVRERLDALIAEGFGATTPTLRDVRAALDTPTPTEETGDTDG